MLSPDPIPFKPTDATAAFTLPDWSVLEVRGADACAFLQAQAMNDLRALADRQWQWSGWLTPKGRVRALFALLRLSADHVLLVVPDLPARALGDELRRFVFRSKAALDGDGWRVAGSRGTAAGLAADMALPRADGGWVLDAGSTANPRVLHLLPAEASSAVPVDAVATAAWREDDLRFGLPRLAAGEREAFTPQMLSLQRLRAFSLSKGCYPGQEIVSRTHYLGQAKRELALLSGGPFSAGGEVRDETGVVAGNIASVAGDGRLALAVLTRMRAPGNLRVDGGEAREEALADGLQRPV